MVIQIPKSVGHTTGLQDICVRRTQVPPVAHGSRVGSVSARKIEVRLGPAPLKSMSIDGANECAASGCAIYTVFATFDAKGHRVDCERLLLPLGGGSTVQQIVASLQLISVKGEFERKSVLSKFETLSQVVSAGRISGSMSVPANDGAEVIQKSGHGGPSPFDAARYQRQPGMHPNVRRDLPFFR
jgi:hypothetical protein